jgi:TetR/AcrR family transcriptional repressor of nem operon
MPWPKEKKQQTRQQLIDAATTLFMQHGYEAVSIDDIMQQAQLTRGGFYHHFPSKSAVYYQAILSALEQGRAFFANINRDNLSDFIRYYLSHDHLNSPLICPLSSITPDIIRRNKQIRTAYDNAFNAFVSGLQQKSIDHQGKTKLSQPQALRLAILMIGGMTLARAINDSSGVGAILSAARDSALAILNEQQTVISR